MKTYRIAFSDFADADLDEILDYIAKDNPVRAISFVDDLREYANDTISLAPKGGRYIDELGAWFLAYKDYVFVYDIHDDERLVVIHMISHSARQWQSIFAGRL